MSHPVWQKTASPFGLTDRDRIEALNEGAMAAAPIAPLSLAALAAMKLQELADRRKAHDEFGNLEQLVNKVRAQNPDLEIPDKIKVFQNAIWQDPLQMGYAALPEWAAWPDRAHLYVPWNLSGMAGNHPERIDKPAARAAESIKSLRAGSYWDMNAGRAIRDKAKYSPSVVMHELGHLAGSGKNNRVKMLQRMGHPALAALTSLGGLGAATSENEYLSMAAPGIAVSGFVPTLLEEARATRNARRMMKNMIAAGGAAPKKMRALWRALGPAYATYAAGAAIPTVASGVLAQKMRERRDRGVLGDVWAQGQQFLSNAGALAEAEIGPEAQALLAQIMEPLV